MGPVFATAGFTPSSSNRATFSFVVRSDGYEPPEHLRLGQTPSSVFENGMDKAILTAPSHE